MKKVLITGAFDVLHPGHIHFIKEAKSKGDYLIIGLNSDKSYRLYKDSRGPVFSQKDRKTILESLKYVDKVVVFDETTPIKIIKKIKPDVYCNTTEYGKHCIELKTLDKLGIKLYVIPTKDKIRYSSSVIKWK